MQDNAAHIVARDITIAYGDFVVQRDLDFTVNRGDVFIIMGGSGCGKSTLLKHLLGLIEPAAGEIRYGDVVFTGASEATRQSLRQRWGITYQAGGLISAMTLEETEHEMASGHTDCRSHPSYFRTLWGAG